MKDYHLDTLKTENEFLRTEIRELTSLLDSIVGCLQKHKNSNTDISSQISPTKVIIDQNVDSNLTTISSNDTLRDSYDVKDQSITYKSTVEEQLTDFRRSSHEKYKNFRLNHQPDYRY